MRILLFLHSFQPGGVERVALRLAGAWSEEGHEVRVLVGRDHGPQRSIAPANLRFEFARPSRMAARFETLWLVRHLVSAVRTNRPDVLFCSGSTYTIVAALVRLFLGPECPPIVCKLSNSLERKDLSVVARSAHGLWLRHHPKFIDQFIGMAEPMTEEIEHCLRVSRNRITTIPDPALTTAEMCLLSAPVSTDHHRGRRYVAVGRLARQKNFALLLRAFAMIASDDDQLVIVGEGPERSRLTRLATQLGIANQIEMPGHLLSVEEALRTADVLVNSSNYEGLPAAVVEALAAGLPIVATQCSACMDQLLGYGELGRLVPIRDVSALAQALQDAPRRHEVPTDVLRASAAQFTIERSAHLYIDVFAKTVTRLSAGPSIGAQPLQATA